jgi:hypothetical protein
MRGRSQRTRAPKASRRIGETALWLLPAAEDGARLRAQIQALSRRLGAPVFEPHVTIFGGVGGRRLEIEAVLARAARETPSFILSPARLAHSPAFFQCLVLEPADPEPVVALRRRLGPELGRRPEDAASPHLSLAYAELAEREREELCRELGDDPRLRAPIRFDALALIAPRRDDATDWRDVEGWRMVGRFPLAWG